MLKVRNFAHVIIILILLWKELRDMNGKKELLQIKNNKTV